MRRLTIAGALLAAVAASSLAGCSQQREECRALLDAVEPPLAEIGALQKRTPEGAPPDRATLHAMSVAYRQINEQIRRPTLIGMESRNVAAVYGRGAVTLAEGLELLADAHEQLDDGRFQTAMRKLNDGGLDEQTATAALADLCGKP